MPAHSSKELEQFSSMPTTTNAEKREAQQKLYVKEIEHLRSLRTIESPRNFSTVKVIGKGAFGEVKLVQRKTDGQIYALKCLVKAEMFNRDQLAHVRAERDILAEVDSPWVVKLHMTFQDKAFLYMLMEFLPGGDLMTMLIKYETFSPDIARFYMAEILLAIEAVHKLGFIHRYVLKFVIYVWNWQSPSTLLRIIQGQNYGFYGLRALLSLMLPLCRRLLRFPSLAKLPVP